MQYLVTGAAGFIGSNYVRYLLNAREDVSIVSLDALTYAGSKANLAGVLDDPRHEFVEGDIRDDELMASLLTDADYVLNFAAESHVDRSIEGAEPFVSTNVEGTRTLLDAALGAGLEGFLQVSTDEVYGQILDGAFTETDPLTPRNPYAASKAGADLLAMSYWHTHELPVVVTRTCNNFGPRQHDEKLIPKFVQRAAEGAELPLYGDGSNVREWIYVADNCRAIDQVLREGSPGEIYNIGTGIERTNLEVAEAIIDAVGGSDDQITFVEDRPGHDQRYALETAKLERLGWGPEWSFEEGLERTVGYYLE
ncbi:dTDP-glucose 4,6-dehydratase [Halorhabdus sp. CUG00001]|uniref:dTDP-glucose 4,6-dehydratase n=1 Tax=Halorhabdus sp. CUG00001 TaxID=2600297 RepID=UPI00131EAFC8|nr:dTDP-glucose 4,6-dehydratase [Halorhabdus sp. CUG00001]